MKNILVTGAAGFMGSHLCDRLLADGHNVIGVDNLFRGSINNLQMGNPAFELDQCDLSYDSSRLHLRQIIQSEKIDTVFHYAAINGTEYFYDIPYEVFRDNNQITRNVLGALAGTTVKKFVYTSSSEVYGDEPIIPTPETSPILLNIFSDRDSYASSKAMGEFDVKFSCERSNISYVILRPFNTYGSRMVDTKYGQVIPEFIKRVSDDAKFTIIGDGTQQRSFCHISDHVRLVVSGINKMHNEIINIGNQEMITINNLAERIHKIANREFKPKYLTGREYDTQHRQPCISKINKLYPEYKFANLDKELNILYNEPTY